MVVLALPVVGCGDKDVGDPIPGGKVTELENQLDLARANFEQARCDEATTSVNRARSVADTLDDDGVGSDVQDAVADGIDNLGSLVTQRCEEEEEEPVETVPETTPEPTITETVPAPTTTETTPPPTTPEPTTPVPAPEPEPDEDDGGAQFDPDGRIPPGQQKKLEDDD